ncbi:MAG: hypothetical protein ACSHXF_03085 [Aquaticitalea sp.]
MKTLKNSMIVGILLIATSMLSQTQEVEFDVYSNSAAKASRYLLADDVVLRDCPATQCEQLTTIKIGTYVRLLAKSETPQTMNDVCSRWYKVKMGPQVGWIWGGLIAQKIMVSNVDSETKFLFGEAGEDINSQKQYQIRAIKNGMEMDKIVFSSYALTASQLQLESGKDAHATKDIFRMSSTYEDDRFITFENGAFKPFTRETVRISECAQSQDQVVTN